MTAIRAVLHIMCISLWFPSRFYLQASRRLDFKDTHEFIVLVSIVCSTELMIADYRCCCCDVRIGLDLMEDCLGMTWNEALFLEVRQILDGIPPFLFQKASS